MLAYHYMDTDEEHKPEDMTYSKIETIVKDCKVHRNVMDQSTGFFNKVWKWKMENDDRET